MTNPTNETPASLPERPGWHVELCRVEIPKRMPQFIEIRKDRYINVDIATVADWLAAYRFMKRQDKEHGVPAFRRKAISMMGQIAQDIAVPPETVLFEYLLRRGVEAAIDAVIDQQAKEATDGTR